MNRGSSAGMAQTSAGYRGAKSFPFAQMIRTVLMFSPVGARAGPRLERMHFRRTPWLPESDSKILAHLIPLRGLVFPLFMRAANRLAVNWLRSARQLAHDQKVLRAYRLFGKRYPVENPGRRLARGPRMGKSTGRAGTDQC